MTKYYTEKIDDPVRPFSNGTEAEMWYHENCGQCTKSWQPANDKPIPTYKTQLKYVACGKYCKLQYWLDIGFIEGSIPREIAQQIGVNHIDKTYCSLKQTCLLFSDNNNDGYKPPKRPRPDNTPSNQLVLFSPFEQLDKSIQRPKSLKLAL